MVLGLSVIGFYRQQAEEADRMADEVDDPEEARLWGIMATAWRAMIVTKFGWDALGDMDPNYPRTPEKGRLG